MSLGSIRVYKLEKWKIGMKERCKIGGMELAALAAKKLKYGKNEIGKLEKWNDGNEVIF